MAITITPREDAMMSAVVNAIAEAINPLKTRNEQLDMRVKALESRHLLKYLGEWHASHTYSAGCLVTRDGKLWETTTATVGEPGTAGSGFRLVARRAA